MNTKDAGKKEKDNSFFDSKELFNRIFKEATQEIKLEKIERKQTPDVVAAPAPGRGQHQTKIPKKKKSAAKAVGFTPPKSETDQTSPKTKAERAESTYPPRSRPKTGTGNIKRSGTLMAAVLLILLAILAGTALSYMGIIDISLPLNYFGFGHEQAAQAPIPAKEPVKSSEKAVSYPQQPREQAPMPSPSPSKPSPSAVSKEEKLVELETPTTIARAKQEQDRVEGEAPSVSTSDPRNAAEAAANQESEQVPVQNQASAKSGAPEVVLSRPRTPQYPYSVYLGSFKTSTAVKKALIEYHEKGLSAYWTKVDLGEKGVWFRFFSGYFRTKEEAEKFIRDRNIQGATPGTTKYANLVGSYESNKEVEDRMQALFSAGFYPYIIRGAEGKSLIYSGAFDRKEYAEKEKSALASMGIRSEVVER